LPLAVFFIGLLIWFKRNDAIGRIYFVFITKDENGTGLGLYITKQLVERNGGKISVRSEENKGTRFVLEF